MKPIINETQCEFDFQGRVFSSGGAYVDNKYAHVYVVRNSDKSLKVTSWHGETLSDKVKVVSEWNCYCNKFGYYKMRAIRFSIGNITYTRRYNADWGQLVRAKAIKQRGKI